MCSAGVSHRARVSDMNREQMVETAAKASWDADTEAHGLSRAYGWQPPGGDALNDGYRKQARIMLDAILPQVSTVAELEALPQGTVLMGMAHEHGPRFARWWGDAAAINGTKWEGVDLLHYYGPLTVVWQPA